jgi:hypothetical protein
MNDSEVPLMPWEISLKNAGWFIEDLPDERKRLKFVPLATTPQGNAPLGVAVEVVFDKTGWDRFCGDVNLGERLPSKVIVPPAGTNGHHN